MTGDCARNTGRTAVTGPSADRQTFAALFALFMGHFCVKMYLHSLYATILQIDADPSHWFSMFSIIILNLAVNRFFAQPRHSVSNGTDLFQLVCGGAFIVAYNLCFLSSATTDVDILRIGTWYTFVFNFGCLAELKLGMVQKLAYTLADI